MASFFEPSIKAAVGAIEDYIKNCAIGVSAVYVVGGFSSSPYLKLEVEQRLQSHNIRVATPDGQVSVLEILKSDSCLLTSFTVSKQLLMERCHFILITMCQQELLEQPTELRLSFLSMKEMKVTGRDYQPFPRPLQVKGDWMGSFTPY